MEAEVVVEFDDGTREVIVHWGPTEAETPGTSEMNNHQSHAVAVPAGATTARVHFRVFNAMNDWYWAIDNVQVNGPEPTCGERTAAEWDVEGFNAIVGTDGDDELVGTNKADVIFGLGGDDILLGDNGEDVLCVGAGDDLLRGGNGADALFGGNGADELFGDNGPDDLRGGADEDVLDGGRGKDTRAPGLIGTAGADRFHRPTGRPTRQPGRVTQVRALGAGDRVRRGRGPSLKPGHGKSLAAAYLVGSEGTVRDAAWLGFSVAAMHTLSVLTVAVAWTFFSLSDLVELEQLTAALQLMVGLLVGGFGASLLRRRLREGPHHHHHHHDHGTSRPGLVLLGTSGGLVPSASAFLVLVTGIFSGRSGLALVLVLAFGIGLATMLFAVGLAAVAGRTMMARSAASRSSIAMAARLAPVLAACVIIVVGVVIAANGVRDLATVIRA